MTLNDGDCETAYTKDGAGFINVEMRHLPTGLRAGGSAKFYDEAKGIARERLALMLNSSQLVEAMNHGHGHVYPRPDGVVARCGGPALCADCKADFDRKGAEMTTPTTAVAEMDNDPHMMSSTTVAMNDTAGFGQGVNHYTVTGQCTCGWIGIIRNTFPRIAFDQDGVVDAIIDGAKDGVTLAQQVHREGKIG